MRLIDVDSKSNAIYVSQFVIDQIQKIPPIDPIRAVGGCRCGECKHGRNSTDAFEFGSLAPLCECDYMTLPHRWYEYCSWGEPKEAQEDE